MIAAWCWDLIAPYLTRNLLNRGVERPTRREVLQEFARVWPEMTATIGVQEPHAGTIRRSGACYRFTPLAANV